MIARAAILALGVTGCAQLFGLDDTTGKTVDAPGPGAHATFTHASIGTTTIASPYDFAANDKVTFLVADDADPSGYRSIVPMPETVGAVHAELDGNPIVDTTIAGRRRIYELPTRDLHVELSDLEHPNAEPPAANATVDLSVTIPAYNSVDTFEVEAIGAWSHYSIGGAEVPGAGATTLGFAGKPYSTFGSLSGHPIARIIPSDTVVVLSHNGPDLDGAFQGSLDQTDTASITGTVAAVTANLTLDANVAPPTVATRLTAVRPSVGSLALSWRLYAAPGWARFHSEGPVLSSGGLMMSDTKISRMYANPFMSLGWNELLVYEVSESRVATVNTVDVTLYAGLQSYVLPAPNMTLDLPAGLPESISADQVPLTTDGMTITVGAKGMHVTFVADHAANIAYRATLFDIVVEGATATLTNTLEAYTTDPNAVWFPADAFVTGHTYTIQIVAYQGTWPNAATGDLATMQPPFHFGYSSSGVFTASK